MKTIWKDYNHTDGEKTYETREEALNVIKSILKEDEGLLRGRNVDDISEDDLFEYGHGFYGIEREEIEPTPCCDNQDMEYDDDGYTDCVEIETWKCKNCEQSYRVEIEIVRDFDNMTKTDNPGSKFG